MNNHRDQHGLLAQCDVVREKLQNFFSVLTTKDNMNQIKEKENEEQSLSVHQSAFVVEEETATLRAEVCHFYKLHQYYYPSL